MHILLINTNRYSFPPTIPVGLEYCATALRGAGYTCGILDLCFSEDCYTDIKSYFSANDVGLAGITVRNIDSVLYMNNEFFLDDIRKLVDFLHDEFHIPVIAGGAGFSIMPSEILEYIHADYGVTAPGENALVSLIKDWERNCISSSIYDGNRYGMNKNLVHYRGSDINYRDYLQNGGNIGFETHRGCSATCTFCPEAKKKIFLKNPVNISKEIAHLISHGYKDFHLCDSEFNNNLSFCKMLCQTFIDHHLDFSWAVYVKPHPVDEELLSLMRRSGVSMITLSVESCDDSGRPKQYSFEEVELWIRLTKKYCIKIAVDLLVGFPGEPTESVAKTIRFFKNNRPDTVGITSHFRLYSNTEIGKKIRENPLFRKDIIGETDNNPSFLRPAFYNNLSNDELKYLIDDDPLFKIEGEERTVNYQRV